MYNPAKDYWELLLKKLTAILIKAEFQVALLCFYFVIFVWPFVAIKNQTNNHFIFYFFFGSWLSIIILHLIMDRITKNEKMEK